MQGCALYRLGLGWVALLATLLAGCAKEQEYHVDPILQPYLDAFFREADSRAVAVERRVSARIVEGQLRDAQGELLVAQCDTRPREGSAPEITISRVFWSETASDEIARRATVFHELGHCALGRSHDSTTLTIGYSTVAPASLMYPNAFVGSNEVIRRFYAHFEAQYVDELFGKAGATKAAAAAVPLMYPAGLPPVAIAWAPAGSEEESPSYVRMKFCDHE